MKRRTVVIAILSAAALGGGLSTAAFAGTKVYLGQQKFTRGLSMDRIDHSGYDALLKKYVNESGNVNYTAWKASAADMQALDRHLALLSSIDPTAKASREAQLAYWINAYNAVTLKGILREYPTDSIKDHVPTLYGYNIWKDLLLYSGGSAYSLDTIEHKILRPAKEPRIHFAIVCASISCPRLRNEAYTADKLEEQLADNSRAFFANPGNFRYDAAGGQMQLSSILKWFGEDFGDDKAAQLKTIAPYLPTPAAQQAAQTGSVGVSHLNYNWGLNDQKTAGR